MLLNTTSKIYFRRSFLLRIYNCWDYLIVLVCFGLAIKKTGPFPDWYSIAIFIGDNWLFISLLLVIWHLSLSYFDLYQSKRLNIGLDYLNIVKATSAGASFIVVLVGLFRADIVTPVFITKFWALSTLAVILTRVCLKYFLILTRKQDRNLRHIIIVGQQHRGQMIAKLLREHPEIGYRVLGFVDNINNNHKLKKSVENKELLGNFDTFSDVLSESTVDEVFIVLPVKSFYDEINTIVNQCKEQGIPARLSSDFFQFEQGKIKFGYLGPTPILTIYNGLEENFAMTIKRILDFLISGVLLFVLSPLLVLVCILIKISSPGSILFSQKRIGLHKREFNLYKFRTMVTNAEALQNNLETLNEATGPVFKITHDPRVTTIGKLLRRYSIDELPQLFNVLKGEMSLVGPRPLPVRDFERFVEKWTRRRFSVRPGITCIWQTSGRSNISFEQWMKLDLKYIDNWSLMLDIKILTKTIPAVIKGTGAY